MSLKYCLTALIIVVQSAMSLSKELDHVDPVKFLLSNESSVFMSSSYYYRYNNDDSDIIVMIIVLSLWCSFIFFSLLLGCIMLCVCKPTQTRGWILNTNKVEVGNEAGQSSSSPMSNSQSQPPPYQAFQQQPLYPPISPVTGPQKSPLTFELQNPIGGNVKPGRIVSADKFAEKQPQSTSVQHFPQSQPPNVYHPSSQQQFINAETPSVIGTQDSRHVTEFNNPVFDS